MKLFFQLNKDKRLQSSDIKGGDKRTKVSPKCTFVAVTVFPPFLWANFVFKSSFPCDVDESLSTNRFISLFRKFFISRRLHFEHAVMCHKYIQKLPSTRDPCFFAGFRWERKLFQTLLADLNKLSEKIRNQSVSCGAIFQLKRILLLLFPFTAASFSFYDIQVHSGERQVSVG